MGMRMGGDEDPKDVKCAINRRKALCGILENIEAVSVVLGAVTLLVELVGNGMYWARWVAEGQLPETFYRFQTGWIFFGVCALVAIVTISWGEYLQKKNAFARRFYRSLTEGKR